MVKTFKKYISALAASALMLGMLTFVPSTFAADDLSYVPAPEAQYTLGGDDFKVSVKLANYNGNNPVDVNLLVGKKGGGNLPGIVDSFTFDKNTTHVFTWDGMFSNKLVEAGEYAFGLQLNNGPVIMEKDLTVKEGPTLTFNPAPAATYTIGSGDYKIPVNLKNFVTDEDTDVSFFVYKKGAVLPVQPISTQVYDKNESHDFIWNGNGAVPGTYIIKFTGKSDNYTTNILEKEIQVKADKTPVIDWNGTPAEEITVGATSYKVSVKMTEFTSDALVDFSVESLENGLLIPRDNFTFTSDEQIHEFSFNPSSLKVGTYKFAVSGKDKNNVETNTLEDTFKVVNKPVVTTCAGYADVPANDPYCKAIELAKTEKWMEGEGDGTNFNPNGNFIRGAMAKVVLEAYDKYSANTDYCKGTEPFKDAKLGVWYTNYVCQGKTLAMITGYKDPVNIGNFKPGNDVTVVEAMCLFLRPLNVSMPAGASYTGLSSTEWYSGCSAYAKKNGLYPGNSLTPTQVMTREQIALFLYELRDAGLL